jgi:hypothetical protein
VRNQQINTATPTPDAATSRIDVFMAGATPIDDGYQSPVQGGAFKRNGTDLH